MSNHTTVEMIDTEGTPHAQVTAYRYRGETWTVVSHPDPSHDLVVSPRGIVHPTPPGWWTCGLVMEFLQALTEAGL